MSSPARARRPVRRLSPAVAPELAREWAERWPDWFGAGRAPLPQAPERADLALVASPLGALVAKRFRRRWRGLALRGRGARQALRAFHAGEALRRAGLATPEPLAVLVARGEAVLVTRHVDGRAPWAYLA